MASGLLLVATLAPVEPALERRRRASQHNNAFLHLRPHDGDVARVRPGLAAYSRNVTHIGPVGAGQIAKSCNQAVVGATFALWAEVIAYARRCGIDPLLPHTESLIRRYS